MSSYERKPYPRQTEIGGIQYDLMGLTYKDSRKMGIWLANKIGQALGDTDLKTGEKVMDMDVGVLIKGLGHVFKDLNDSDFDLLERVYGANIIARPEGQAPVDLSKGFEGHFQGRFGDVIKLFFWAIKESMFDDFLAGNGVLGDLFPGTPTESV